MTQKVLDCFESFALAALQTVLVTVPFKLYRLQQRAAWGKEALLYYYLY